MSEPREGEGSQRVAPGEPSELGGPGTPLISCRGVSKRFGRKVVYDGLDLEVRRGETLVLLGRSGVGKSVLLKLLLGLERPDAGEILAWRQPVSRLSEAELVSIRRRIGMVFQGGALFDSLTIAENVAYGLREHERLPQDRILARVRECLELVDLKGVEHLLPDQLSGGMRKRVAIARAVATSPEVLLYDEPTTGLDPVTGRRVNSLIRGLQAKLGVTSIVVTHDIESMFAVADRVALVSEGRIAWVGPIDVVRDDPPPSVARFLGRAEADADPEADPDEVPGGALV